MALDVGSVRLGVALSDLGASFAQPWVVWPIRQPSTLQAVAELARSEGVVQVVVGRPLRMSGEAGLATQAVEKFVEILRPHLEVPIIWWDERLSTRAATRALVETGMRRRQQRVTVDKVAAAWLLQGYLEACRRPVPPPGAPST